MDKIRERALECHQRVAEALGCELRTVSKVFDWKPDIYCADRQTVKETLSRSETRLKLSGLAKRFIKEIERADDEQVYDAVSIYGIDLKALKHLADHWKIVGEIHPEAPIRKSSQGGKNWAAYYVAEAIAELFVLLDRRVTFGHVSGEPTTEFGRSVQHALSIFEVQANWREPARVAALNTDLDKDS